MPLRVGQTDPNPDVQEINRMLSTLMPHVDTSIGMYSQDGEQAQCWSIFPMTAKKFLVKMRRFTARVSTIRHIIKGTTWCMYPNPRLSRNDSLLVSNLSLSPNIQVFQSGPINGRDICKSFPHSCNTMPKQPIQYPTAFGH